MKKLLTLLLMLSITGNIYLFFNPEIVDKEIIKYNNQESIDKFEEILKVSKDGYLICNTSDLLFSDGVFDCSVAFDYYDSEKDRIMTSYNKYDNINEAIHKTLLNN